MAMREWRSHKRIVDYLRRRITTGVAKSGERLPSFEQLHRQFGVARNTIGKAIDVLEADGLVDRRYRSGVFVRVDPGKRTRQIAVTGVTRSLRFESDYWNKLITGLHDSAAECGAQLSFFEETTSIPWTEFEGLLAFSPATRLAAQLRPPHFPIVAVCEHFPEAPSVTLNEYAGGLEAAQHLIDLGHSRIGFLGWVGTATANQRIAGYHTALYDSTYCYEPSLVRQLHHVRSVTPIQVRYLGMPSLGYDNMATWFESGFESLGCTALIVQNDFTAFGVIEYLQERGISVPEDISVVGFDNEPACESSDPPLTSVSGDMSDVVRQAMINLINQMDCDRVPNSITMLPVSVTVRASTTTCKSIT